MASVVVCIIVASVISGGKVVGKWGESGGKW